MMRLVGGGVVEPNVELVEWLREYLERAERGELVAVAIAVVKSCGDVGTAWVDVRGVCMDLVGATSLLACRVVKAANEAFET